MLQPASLLGQPRQAEASPTRKKRHVKRLGGCAGIGASAKSHNTSWAGPIQGLRCSPRTRSKSSSGGHSHGHPKWAGSSGRPCRRSSNHLADAPVRRHVPICRRVPKRRENVESEGNAPLPRPEHPSTINVTAIVLTVAPPTDAATADRLYSTEALGGTSIK